MFFRCSKLILEKQMTFLAGTDDASRNRKAGQRAAA